MKRVLLAAGLFLLPVASQAQQPSITQQLDYSLSTVTTLVANLCQRVAQDEQVIAQQRQQLADMQTKLDAATKAAKPADKESAAPK